MIRTTNGGLLLPANAIMFVVLVLAAPVLGSGRVIEWRSGAVQMGEPSTADLATAISGLAARPDASHVVVQFRQPVGSTVRRLSSEAGMTLLSYLGNHAFFASFAADVDEQAVSMLPCLKDVRSIDRSWKLDSRIVSGSIPEWAVVSDTAAGKLVAVYVLFHPDVNLATDAVAVAQEHGGTVRDELRSINVLVVELPESEIEALADEDAVQWIEWPLPLMGDLNDGSRASTQADVVQAPPYDLDGTGVTVLVYDSRSARATHVDFEGRLTVGDSTTTSDHATHVAGTIGGAGIADSTYRGMAPGVDMLSYGNERDFFTGILLYSNPGDLEDDYDEAINTYGADISNNSIGTNVENNGFDCAIQGDYGITAALLDSIVAGSLGDPFRIVWSAGNERSGDRCDVEGYGDYYSTAPPAGAKNPISVGAINSNDESMTDFSSWGPLDDGRTKPDVCAPGCQTDGDLGVTSCSSSSDTAYRSACGTSMAAPATCGLCALLMQDFRSFFPTQPDPRNSTLKALLVHNADDFGAVGPDYQYGYGVVRIQETIDYMRIGNFLEDELVQGETFITWVSVEAGDELKVTVAWDDAAGAPNVVPALVNDLDLRVYDSSGVQYYPWTLDPTVPADPAVRIQADRVNNIEQVVVDAPAAGLWRVEVVGFDVPQGPQSFTLAASPQLVSCSSQGAVLFGAQRYGCTATAHVRVVDCDLNANPSVAETVTVSVASPTEPGGETVLLTETGSDTSDFRGTVQLDVVDASGVLQVAEGDTVNAVYIDADDGLGGVGVPVEATMTVDCLGPQISNVHVPEIDTFTATVSFETDERAVGTVWYGSTCETLNKSVVEPYPRTSHDVVLTGLSHGTPYYYAIEAEDEQGNESGDDNSGSCYSFCTREIVYTYSLNSNPGWTSEGNWGYGQPLGGGSHNGDPTAGYTGWFVYGYNLSGDYENDLPATYLTTAAIDCSGTTNTALRFRRWLGIESADYGDGATIEVSDDGLVWDVVWDHTGSAINESSWSLQTLDISAVADGESQVYIRWGMGPTGWFVTYPGWNIDDVQIIADGSVLEPTCSDSVQNQGEDRIDCGGPCAPCECTSDAACSDGAFCTGNETCDAFGHCLAGEDPCPGLMCDEVSDVCVECLSDEDCADEFFCNGEETCDAEGDCQPGTAVNCNDGVSCTVDSCNEGTDSCDNVADDALCDNGLYCDGTETCDQVQDCQDGTPIDCNDGVDCTLDHCIEETDSCENVPNDGACDNGLYCDGNETCDPILDCLSGTAVDCSDEHECTIDSCNELTDSCDNVPDDELCSNGVYCDGAETCNPLLGCQAGAWVNCYDGVSCTVDSCNETTDSCDNVPDDEACSNGIFCDGVEICDPILGCLSGPEVDCADEVNCTVDFCDEATETCKNLPDDDYCADPFYCNGVETCDVVEGCLPGSNPCPPEEFCRESDHMCVECLMDSDCDDEDPCTGNEACDPDGICLRVVVHDCNGNSLEDFCDIDAGTSEDCNVNEVPDECDIGQGTSADSNGDGVPDECELQPPSAAPVPHDITKNRYISLVPNNGTVAVAIAVEATACEFAPESIGFLGWIGEPNGDDVARVADEPVYRVWGDQVHHVSDCQIVPAATYSLRTTPDGVTFSDPLVVQTTPEPLPKHWADCVGELVNGNWTPPNGFVNTADIMAIIQAFEFVPTAPDPKRVDLDPEVTNAVINMTDVSMVVQGFKGMSYPFNAPLDCP